MWPFLLNILKPTINLKTFGGRHLKNRKQIQIFKPLKKAIQQVFCV
jgi:hypothetical protein